MRRHVKHIGAISLKIIGTALLALLVAGAIWVMSGEGVDLSSEIKWGVTFSPRQTEYIGLDTGAVYKALLDDMGVRRLRLMAPWYKIEPAPGKYDFSDVDWYLNEAKKRNATVILVLGRKLFRWPECHEPAWTRTLAKEEFETKVLALLQTSVNHFKQYDNVVAWQIENEATLPFGECREPKPNWDLLRREIDLVRRLDGRPIVSTESGELSSWLKIGGVVDWLGVSLYRLTNNPFLGKIYYPFRPGFYQKKAVLAQALNPNLKKVFISELQLEPWGNKPLREMTLAEQYERMSWSRTQSIVNYAQHTGLPEIYIWGAEWWYWLKQVQKDDRFWKLGKSLMRGQ